MSRRYVLSIDGGGIRGIIPAIALTKLEDATGRPARETFSFMAGTSTGAIIAAALAAGVPASRVLRVYLEHPREVFTGYPPVKTLRRIFSGHMYSTRKLRALISSELGTARGWSLNDSPVDILVTATRVPDGMPWYFVRDSPRNSGRTGNLPLADCVTASAAAPTYFEPWEVPDDIGALVDGSVGVAGNPVYQACVEAFHYSDGYRPEETTVVSLGTGRFLDKRRPTWIWPWLRWTLGELLESPGEQQTEIAWRHYPQTTFYRIDTELDEYARLDNVASIPRLRDHGERLAEHIDWPAILAGTDTTFRVNRERKVFPRYSQPAT